MRVLTDQLEKESDADESDVQKLYDQIDEIDHAFNRSGATEKHRTRMKSKLLVA